MTPIRGHYDGKQVVLDEPMPVGIAPNAPVTIVLPNGTATNGAAADAFDTIAAAARSMGLPPDFAARHDHSTTGLPKR